MKGIKTFWGLWHNGRRTSQISMSGKTMSQNKKRNRVETKEDIKRKGEKKALRG